MEHITGTTNTVADLLSRRKDLNKGVDSDLPRTLLPDHLFSPSPPPPNTINKTRTLLPDHLFSPSPPLPDTINKTFVADDPEMRREILRSLHDSPVAGYPSIANTWELVREHYEGPQL